MPEIGALLGDAFLRSAYVVFDVANRQLGIAQANVKAKGSSIVEIRKGDIQFPDVDGVPGLHRSLGPQVPRG